MSSNFTYDLTGEAARNATNMVHYNGLVCVDPGTFSEVIPFEDAKMGCIIFSIASFAAGYLIYWWHQRKEDQKEKEE